MIGSTSSSTGGLSAALIEIQSRVIQDSSRATSKSSAAKSNPTPKTTADESGSSKTSSTSTELSSEQQTQVRKLKDRDAEVRAHEQAHIAAGGSLVRGGVHYDYTTGPDNKRYATGGEVSIDTSPVRNDPKATIQKGERGKRAALAPAKPSSQDYAVASSADQMIIAAQMELVQTKTAASNDNGGEETQTASIPLKQVAQAYSQTGASSSAGFNFTG
jgi:hypothetical protein